MKFINPYSGIDWDANVLVRGISHEHIYQTSQLKNAWDRGIRWFACVNYNPAVSAAPDLAGWSGTFKRWNYYDVSAAHPTGGIGGTDEYDSTTAEATVPVDYVTDGLVIAYKSVGGTVVYEKYEDGSWSSVSDLSAALELMDETYSSSCNSFTDADDNEVDPSDLPAVGNAEHAIFRRPNGTTATSHFNVLGNMFSEACVWTKPFYPRSFVNANPIYDLADIKTLFTSDLQFTGKYFGTLNHSYDLSQLRTYIKNGDGLFRAMELFNQGFTKEANRMFRDAYDALLRDGVRLFAVAVADWQGAIEFLGYTGQDMSQYVPECDFDRGCNVLVMPSDYESLTKSEQAEAGLDAYISGAFFASGLGNHHPTELSASGDGVLFSVDGSPSKVRVVTSKRDLEFTNTDTVSVTILPGETYIRFEVFYNDKDFIYTNPIWIEDNAESLTTEGMILIL